MKIKVNTQNANNYIETVDSFHLHSIPLIRKRQNKKAPHYIKQPAFLDTETSHNHDEEKPIGWIYQFCIEFDNEVVIGQSPMQLIGHLQELKEIYGLCSDKRIIIYVHNLSYDYQYLYPFLVGVFGEPELLAIKAHKILSAHFDGIEFRCSYLLSNMSLAQWGSKLGCSIKKMVGAIDYEQIHYQDDILPMIAWEYMVNDVLAMKECLYREMSFYGDDLVTIPLTSTGYVRRDCRIAARKDKTYRKWFVNTKLSVDCYKLARSLFAGGLTHGNRHLGGQTIYNVGHNDKKSHYPSCQMMEYFPIGPWLHYYNYQTDGVLPLNSFNSLINTYCCMFRIVFKNLRIKKGITCPCVSKHKINNYWDVNFTNDRGFPGCDNGRVINAVGSIMLGLTELDYYWVRRQYDTDGIFLVDMYCSERGHIKEPIKNTINQYFIFKESLPNGMLRNKSKAKLNGIYGMSATDVVRTEITFDYNNMEWTEHKDLDDENIQEQLSKYYKSRNSFNNYTHGIYTTSWARYILLDIIQNVVGYENFIYADTDSCFYKDSPEVRARIEEYNKKQVERNKELGLGVDNSKGAKSYYGTFDYEDHCKAFRFLHSKCYALITDDDEFQVTIAGVTKDNKQPKGHPERVTIQDELGSIDNLADGFVFKECGGTKSKYVESPVRFGEVNGHNIVYASSCIISKTTKTLGGTVEGFEEYEMD